MTLADDLMAPIIMKDNFVSAISDNSKAELVVQYESLLLLREIKELLESQV